MKSKSMECNFHNKRHFKNIHRVNKSGQKVRTLRENQEM